MRRFFGRGFAALCGATLVSATLVGAQSHRRRADSHAKLVAHGKYLVENIGMCGDCHSPRNEKGELIPSRHLGGRVLDFQPMHPVPGWVPVSPPIAGLPGWTREQAVKFLMMGIAKDGKPAGPPMPPFRLSKRDAEAVVAYLKSLGSEQ